MSAMPLGPTPDQEILRRLDDGWRRVILAGCQGSYLALLLARLAHARERGGPLVVITPTEEQARELTRDLGFFLGQGVEHPAMHLPTAMHLPAVESSPYSETTYDRVAVMRRLAALFRVSQGFSGDALIASAASLRAKTLDAVAFNGLCDLVTAEEELDRDAFAARLLAGGYHHVQVVEDPGTFAVRGGILDLYPPLCRFPARLEFYADWVETIRLFDPGSQRTLRSVEEVLVHPVRETIRTGRANVRQAILAAADAVNHPSSRTRAVLEEVSQGREFFGVEALTPAFHKDGLAAPWTYLPEDTHWVVVDPEGVKAALKEQDARAEAAHLARLEQGRLTFPPGDFFLPQKEVTAYLDQRSRLEVPATLPSDQAADAIPCLVRDNADLTADLTRARANKGEAILGALAVRARAWLGEGRPVVIAAGGRGQAERMEAMLRGYNLESTVETEQAAREARLLHADPREAPTLTICAGSLGHGFRVPGGPVLLSEAELFGPRARRAPPPKLVGPGLGDLRDLREGDHVVHAAHGVARYLGLEKLEIRGAPADFLHLEFSGSDKLYLPVYRMSQVQKYVGAEDASPKLDRLGGVTWTKKKGKVKKEVRKLAEELLQLYAQRAALEGHAFPAVDAAYSEFEATFPFTPTDDQARAIEDVLGDLCAPRPMDRLVCGDVGFGKTEVALRGAFVAAMSGRQVAVLAPTTVLVEQHHRSFSDRMGPYPLRVEAVSRFRPPAELRTVLADLAAGKVDVVVGTHRLLSSDVRFRDLGLIIIDEEQRFGVAHKEKLKRLRTQVDVLTLTATPIPRTLQMGMVGLREISMISTPPVDRLAIRTFVSRFDDNEVAEGIHKELDRGGQVFFVHNRVQSIDEFAARIQALVPQARVAIGHGQMDARRLERVMVDFVAGRYDVLVCTAIIESGLDIPRANTMFVNRADRFGLSQLYQLRGRIGRSRHRAFCHLLVPGFEKLNDVARQRLAALQRFTELGSGFSVASHDLEIRGAGDLLGGRQHGVIAAVGFETYARILEEAVAELRGEPISRETDPELNTGVAAFIPDDYVEDTGQRLDLYRRLSQASSSQDQVFDILAEIQDRYGPYPVEVDALCELMVVRGLAAALGVTVVDLSPTRLTLTLGDSTPLSAERLVSLVSNRSRGFTLSPDMRLAHKLTTAEQLQPLEATKAVLRELGELARK